MKALRFIFLFVIFLSINQVSGQENSKINDLTKIIGKWECVKVTRLIKNKTEDISMDYKPNYISYSIDHKFVDEYPASNTTVTGAYSVAEKTKLVVFKKMKSTTKYPNAKVPMNDLVQQGFKPPLKIIKLTSLEMTLLDKENENSEGPGDYYFYFKRVK